MFDNDHRANRQPGNIKAMHTNPILFTRFSPSRVTAAVTPALAILWILSTFGCNNNTPPSPRRQSPTTANAAKIPLDLIVVDRSGSTAYMRATQIALARAVYAYSGEWGEEAEIDVLDSQIAPVVERHTPQSNEPVPQYALDKLNAVEDTTQTDQSAGEKADDKGKAATGTKQSRAARTRPALLWKQLLSEIQNDSSDRPIRVFFLTDGDNDWAGDEKEIATDLAAIGRNPHVYITIAGLNMDNANSIRKQFAPFGDRFDCTIGPDRSQMVAAKDRLLEKGIGK